MLFGGLGDDTISGGNGINFLIGDAGNDTLIGGDDNDVLDGGTGADIMTGGKGNDTYYVDNVGDIVNENGLNDGIDRVYATVSFSLTGTASAVENAYLFGIGDFNLTGNDLNNILAGNDRNNVLDGGLGNDTLSGGAGNDTLIGGSGNDTLTGGAGADTFVFGSGSGQDRITDFNRTEDFLDLRAYGIDTAADSPPLLRTRVPTSC